MHGKKLFKDLDFDSYKGTCVLLDIDGTLLPDSAEALDSETKEALSRLTSHATVLLCTNNFNRTRAQVIADSLLLPIVDTKHRKPDPRILRSVDHQGRSIVVMGDKFSTDGIFAHLIGATFVPVKRIKSPSDSIVTNIAYAIDGIVYGIFSFISGVVGSKIGAYIRLSRILQWVKNLLLLVPLFFSGLFLDIPLLGQAVLGFFAFSLVASAGYVLNDILDREEDRLHPRKSKRPVAAREISVIGASMYGISLLLLASYLVSFVPVLIPWIAGYVVLQTMYSALLKRIPVVEMVTVPLFYVLRVLAGGVVIGVSVSGWLILTTFFSVLFMTGGKRYAEATMNSTRSVLKAYPIQFLQAVPIIGAVLTILSYALYSILGTTHELVIYSNIFVVIGVLWYLNKIYKGTTENPEKKLWTDLPLLSVIGLWGLFLVYLYYFEQLILLLPV